LLHLVGLTLIYLSMMHGHSNIKFINIGFLAVFFFRWAGGLACCINHQPGGPGYFWSRFSSSSLW